jgi:plastocyanin
MGHIRNSIRHSVMGWLMVVCGLSTASAGVDVTGQVTLAGKGAAREAVVYLEGGKSSAPMTKAVVDQRDKLFQPHVSVVTVGTTVQFPNNDTVFHNVFAYFHAKKFDLGMYPRGATRSVTFDKKGLVSILCNIHSDMSAYVLVVDTPYYAVTDKQGRFTLRDVPPGTYTLRGWHESGAVLSQSLTVKAGDTAVTLTLAKK